MKSACLAFAFPCLVANLLAGANYAQETEVEENAQYEKLKVLEPLVGEYRYEAPVQANGEQREWRLLIFWNKQKKMLLGESRNRRIDGSATVKEKEWNFGERQYYVWNDREGRIESFQVRPARGLVNTCEVRLMGNGVFVIKLLGSTGDPVVESAQITMTATDAGITTRYTGRKDPDGQPLEDMEFTVPRVSAGS